MYGRVLAAGLVWLLQPAHVDAAPEPGLPDKLGASDILDGVSRIKGAVAACGRDHQIARGTPVAIEFQVAGSTGEVDVANVVPTHGGLDPRHPAVPCLQTAARGARFPRFGAEHQTFTYKFRL